MVAATGTTPAPAGPAIEARDLYRFYHAGDEETLALRGVSLAVDAGELVAVVGPSGSGKSTLLACLAGLDDPDGGVVRVAGERISRRTETDRARIRGASIGMLMQSRNLVEHLTVEENVRAAQTFGRRGHRTVAEVLHDVGLDHRRGASPSTLSGGEAARAGVAVALASGPAVLLADEPTSEIDAASEQVVLGLLVEAAKSGTAVVVVTHSDRVAAAASRVVRLRDGEVVDA